MPATKYDYIAIEDDGRAMAHVFVAPQDMTGLDIGYGETGEPAKGRRKVTGDLFIGNQNDGYYTIDFELIVTQKGGTVEFQREKFDLSKGRCFVVRTGYKISQLPCQTKEEALAALEK